MTKDNRLNVTRRTMLLGTAAVLGSAALTGVSTGMARAQDGDVLRLAVTGSNADSLDPHRTQGQLTDIVRFTNLFDGLCEFNPDTSVANVLAESFTPNEDATVWTVKLVSGVKTHAGGDFGADDVIYSVKRILDPANPTKGGSLIGFIDAEKVEKIDDLTIRFTLATPYGPFREIWANRYLRMVTQDFDPAAPVGTGPFKYLSFAPGQESMFERFDDYFRGKAGVAKVQITNISDETASINALRGGQVDMAYKIPFAEARILEAEPGIKLLNNPSGMSLPLYMRTDIAPFNDVRVRQAFRLIADRDMMVRAALAGYGEVGNDMQGRSIAPCGPTEVEQRKQDIEAAKKLLEEAGQSGLSVELATVNGTSGMVECAQVFAEQAKAAGVTVKVNVLEEAAYLANYGEWAFGVDFLNDTYLPLVARSLVPGGSFNNTHWDDAEFNALFAEASASSDEAKRCEIISKMRMIEHERGGNIIWGFANILNAYSDRLQGLETYVVDSAFYHLRKVSFV